MSAVDKIKNKAEELVGEGKEKAGEHTGNEELRTEGQKDQVSGNVKQAGEKVKDVFKYAVTRAPVRTADRGSRASAAGRAGHGRRGAAGGRRGSSPGPRA
ncbi:MAG: CsbD family protein, partial [Klenkia sp.]|nr:CsbD family protein [Klenkia sp.]